MRPRWSRIAAVVSTLAVVVGATACSSSDESDELLIYNAQHESLTKEWVDAFTAETGIKVTCARATTPRCPTRSSQEGQASPADVFLTENSPAMAQVENAGLFADRGQGHRRPGPRRIPPLHQQVDRHRSPLHRAGL